MEFKLKEYSLPKEYPRDYSYNFHAVNGIQNDVLLNSFVRDLSCFSGVPYEIILTDLKNYLMIRHEYYFGVLDVNIRNVLLLPKFILSFVKNAVAKKYGTADLILDIWFPNAIRDFYTTELEAGLLKEHKCLFVDFNSIIYAKPRYFFKFLIPFVLSFFRCSGIIKKHNLDLRPYVYLFFKKLLIGLTIKQVIKPKLIISGNDNGFVSIIAKMAGAELMFIQNGRRSLASHFAFKYADHYVAMTDIYRRISSGLTNDIFKNIYNFGSIRLYENLKKNSNGSRISYDLLWVSSLTALPGGVLQKSNWSHYYDDESECAAIKIINNFSQKSNLRIAYQCKTDYEIEELEKAELKSDKIFYFTPSMQNTYKTLFQSKAVLTPVSTVCLEAMGIGKKVGFVNLSGNDFLNLYFKDLDIEFNQESTVTFECFIDKIMNQQLDYKAYFFQNQNYITDLLDIIKKVANRKRLDET